MGKGPFAKSPSRARLPRLGLFCKKTAPPPSTLRATTVAEGNKIKLFFCNRQFCFVSIKKSFFHIDFNKIFKTSFELSGICDCAKSTISGIESRKNFPSFELLLKIAYALEVHPADLFLRNASKNREEIRDFFDNELSITIKEMIEERFPKEK